MQGRYFKAMYSGRNRYWSFPLSVLLVGLFSGCLVLNVADDEGQLPQSIDANLYSLSGADLNVHRSGDAAGIPVVFIHGTPGSASFFTSYLSNPSLQDLQLFAIDRPGWGNSEMRGEFKATLASQSDILGEWLCRIADNSAQNKLLIVAHSYGATLTPRLIADHPRCISAALLLAGAADPQLAAPRWYNTITNVPPVSWLVSLSGMGLKRSNDEMMQVQTGLEEMRARWSSINIPVTVIQGETDMLVHPDNADFIESNLAHLPAEVIRFEDDGHMIVHSRREFVIAQLRKMLEVM